MFLSVNFLLGIDPSSHLGRLDYASLPQQALMEVLIDGITENKEKICGSQVEPEDISEWYGVKLNENGEIIAINWGYIGLEGTLNLEWLPSTVRTVDITHNNLTGSIHLEALPSSMRKLYYLLYYISGAIDLCHLPVDLKDLTLSDNQLSGPVDLTNLPAGLQKLYLSDNKFTGETDFSRLPKSLRRLFASNTELEGEIHLQDENRNFKMDNSKVKIVVEAS